MKEAGIQRDQELLLDYLGVLRIQLGSTGSPLVSLCVQSVNLGMRKAYLCPWLLQPFIGGFALDGVG